MKIGQLLLHRGTWGDRIIIPEHYLQKATTTQITAAQSGTDIGYGFLFWINHEKKLWPSLPERSYAMLGYCDNICLVVEEWDLVLVHTSRPEKCIFDPFLPHLQVLFDLLATAMNNKQTVKSRSIITTSFHSLTPHEDFMRSFGAAHMWHETSDFWAHLEGVGVVLKDWGARQALVDAGTFHSVYGTDRFVFMILPLDMRDQVRQLIGEEAEELVYLNCAFTQDVLYAELQSRSQRWSDNIYITDRFQGKNISISAQMLADIVTLNVANSLEQEIRKPPDWQTSLVRGGVGPPNFELYSDYSACRVKLAVSLYASGEPYLPSALIDSYQGARCETKYERGSNTIKSKDEDQCKESIRISKAVTVQASLSEAPRRSWRHIRSFTTFADFLRGYHVHHMRSDYHGKVLDHLRSTMMLLLDWGSERDVAAANDNHRGRLKRLIGESAERLVWLFHRHSRAHLAVTTKSDMLMVDRFTGEKISCDSITVAKILTLHTASLISRVMQTPSQDIVDQVQSELVYDWKEQISSVTVGAVRAIELCLNRRPFYPVHNHSEALCYHDRYQYAYPSHPEVPDDAEISSCGFSWDKAIEDCRDSEL